VHQCIHLTGSNNITVKNGVRSDNIFSKYFLPKYYLEKKAFTPETILDRYYFRLNEWKKLNGDCYKQIIIAKYFPLPYSLISEVFPITWMNKLRYLGTYILYVSMYLCVSLC